MILIKTTAKKTKRGLYSLVITLLFWNLVFSQTIITSFGNKTDFENTAAQKDQSPKLVVMIAVDGLGADIFNRYDSLFSGGFRRLKNEGMNFTNAMVNHSMTISHPGHVTLATGMNPSHHGIVDAAFYERHGNKWQFTDAVQDDAEKIIGFPDVPAVSPKKIQSATFPQWILQNDKKSRFAAVGTGKYSSLLHAGNQTGDVYWFDQDVGRYVTSSYYLKNYPDWLEKFNRDRLPEFIEDSFEWKSAVPKDSLSLARPDNSLFKGFELGKFPHIFKNEISAERQKDVKSHYRWFADTPWADAATLALAKEAITQKSLGQRDSTDYLSIVVSQVDDISHHYGSGSLEQFDNLLRLDRELGEFFNFLDKTVGKNNYLIALSADHGMMDIPEYRSKAGKTARRISAEEINAALEKVRAVSQTNASYDEKAEKTAQVLEKFDFVASAMTPQQLLKTENSSDPFIRLFKNSYSAMRVPRFPLFDFNDGTSPIGEAGVVVRLTEGSVIDLGPAIHGSPYEYDRYVPLLFMGKGVTKSTSNELVTTADVAPTLAKLAGIKFPSELDGEVLSLKKASDNAMKAGSQSKCDQNSITESQKNLLSLFKAYYQTTKENSDNRWNYTTAAVKLWFDDKNGKPILQVKGKKSSGKWKDWDEEMNSTSHYECLRVDEKENAVKGYFFENNDFYELIGKPPTKTLRTFWFDKNNKIYEILIYWIPEENRVTSEYLKPVVEWAEKNHPDEIKDLYPNGEIIPSRENAKRWKNLLKKYNSAKSNLRDQR